MNIPVTRVLKRLVAAISEEAEKNPGFAARLATALELQDPESIASADAAGSVRRASPRPAGGRRNRRPPAAVDPLLLMEQGEDALRSALAPLDVEQLKDVVAEYGMDTTKLALKWKARERLEDLIVTTVRERLAKGDAFRREV